MITLLLLIIAMVLTVATLIIGMLGSSGASRRQSVALAAFIVVWLLAGTLGIYLTIGAPLLLDFL